VHYDHLSFFVMPPVAALVWKNIIMHPGYGVLADINRALGFRLSRETGTWKGVVGAEHLGSDMFCTSMSMASAR